VPARRWPGRPQTAQQRGVIGFKQRLIAAVALQQAVRRQQAYACHLLQTQTAGQRLRTDRL
jgi:hypothetical protein